MYPYWVTLNGVSGDFSPFPAFGAGVTAQSPQEALEIVSGAFGIRERHLSARRILDMSELEQNHVAPNMDPHWMIRGIWYSPGHR